MAETKAVAKLAEVAPISKKVSILAKLAAKYSVDPQVMAESLKQVAFRQKDGTVISDAQMVALLIVADQYGLNPFTKEIYAYPDKNNGIIPVVGVDGWNRIANEHSQADGETVSWSENIIKIDDDAKDCPESCTVTIYRKDRSKPTEHTEWLDEVYRPPFEKKGDKGAYTIKGPWQSHTKRMLEHKARIQARRIAFGFGGIYDEDEAQRIVDAEVIDSKPYGGKQAPAIMPKPIQAPQAVETPAERYPNRTPLEEISYQAELLKVSAEDLDGMVEAELGYKTLMDVPNKELPNVLELLKAKQK